MSTARYRYKADFNDVSDDGLITTLPGWGGSVVIPPDGEMVELVDGDGNGCYGFVERVDSTNALIFVRPDWSSWHDAPQSTLPALEDALFEAMRAGHEGVKTKSDLIPAA